MLVLNNKQKSNQGIKEGEGLRREKKDLANKSTKFREISFPWTPEWMGNHKNSTKNPEWPRLYRRFLMLTEIEKERDLEILKETLFRHVKESETIINLLEANVEISLSASKMAKYSDM